MIWIPKQIDNRKYPMILFLYSFFEIGGEIENSINIGPARIIKEDSKPEIDISNKLHIFTSYDSKEHSQSGTYLNPLIYQWLLRQKRE